VLGVVGVVLAGGRAAVLPAVPVLAGVAGVSPAGRPAAAELPPVACGVALVLGVAAAGLLEELGSVGASEHPMASAVRAAAKVRCD